MNIQSTTLTTRAPLSKAPVEQQANTTEPAPPRVSLPSESYEPDSALVKTLKYGAGAIAGGALGVLVGRTDGLLSGVAGAAIGSTGGVVAGAGAGIASIGLGGSLDNYGLTNVVGGAALGGLAGLAAGIAFGGFQSGAAATATLGALGGALGLGVSHQFVN